MKIGRRCGETAAHSPCANLEEDLAPGKYQVLEVSFSGELGQVRVPWAGRIFTSSNLMDCVHMGK